MSASSTDGLPPDALAALARVDLNLLRALDALISERSVTLAAVRLSIGQPAMSAALARLRRLFNDPLLVREGTGLVPTPVAESLRAPITRALSIVSTALNCRMSFDPARDERTFTVIAGDHIILVLLKRVLSALRVEAPNVKINVLPMVPDFAGQVRRDQADLVVAPGDRNEDCSDLMACRLLTDRFVCAVSADHPEVRHRATRQQLARYPCLTYDDGPGSSAIRGRLRAEGIGKDFDVRTQSFVVAALMIEGTSIIGILPSRVAELFADRAGLRIVEPSVDLAGLTEVMYWNPLNDNEPAHLWLRQRLILAARDLA